MVFREPREWFGVIMDLFKTKQSQDIKKEKKEKKKKEPRLQRVLRIYL